MATASRPHDVEYPTSDGRPMAETDRHRDEMVDLIQTLKRYYAAESNIYVSGNLLLYYVPGDKRRHVSPDVFVVKGVPKGERDYYLLWEEGKSPDFVIELTSASTRDEDLDEKFRLYRDVLRVREYVLFDPLGDYLIPRLRGYRLRGGKYVSIRLVNGRLPSGVLGLHLEPDGWQLRLYDPATGQRLLTPQESEEEERTKRREAEARQREAEKGRRQAELARRRAEAEVERLRRELEELRRRPPGTG